ncbi:hypothetical protein JXA32_02425 [Candidatus Sumerlaeota bacterium]|nr:hypothetical protein [Candidatus Sumerlaeota bacterium]
MDIHERLAAFWAGERPDQIPYTIYQNEWRHTQNDPAWQAMFENGLGVVWHVSPFRSEMRDVESVTEQQISGGAEIKRQTLKTPHGEIWQSWKNGWHDKYFLKTAEDYRIMTEIVRNTNLTPQFEVVAEMQEKVLPYGIVLIAIGRTPLQTMLVDYAGIENFSMHLFELESEVHELYDALLDQFRKIVEIAAGAPGRFVSNLENFTAESLGPQRYAQYLLPVYQECFPVLHSAGKIVGTHYDGRTACCKELIAGAPIDLIESLTEPNEGDQTLAEARAAWPDKLFWCNIRVSDYALPPSQLREKVLSLAERGSVDGKRLAFEVSEQYPENWKESMPVVLDALKETRC